MVTPGYVFGQYFFPLLILFREHQKYYGDEDKLIFVLCNWHHNG